MIEADLGWSALAGLTAISVACAAVTLLAFKRFSNQQAIARTKSLAQAHLLEFRLFMDEPLLVLRSQRALLMDQVRLLALLGKPLLIVALPMLLLLGQLEAVYGRVPLRPGEATVVTAKGVINAPLQAPEGIAVESPPVRIDRDGEVSWRIRPLRPASGFLQIGTLRKRIVAGWGLAYTTELPVPGVQRIEVRYPPATVLGLHWLIWFLLITTVAGLLLRRPLRVAL